LIEVRLVKPIAEFMLVPGSIEVKGGRISKVQNSHVWVTDAAGKEHHTVIDASSVLKNQSGNDLQPAELLKLIKAGTVMDVVAAPLEKGRDNSLLLFARLVKE
jgi:hypothetical protein